MTLRLGLFFGKENIIAIRRLRERAEVEVYSDTPAEVLGDLLREREDNCHLAFARSRNPKRAAFYDKLEKQLSRHAPCEPIMRTVNGMIEHGLNYLHDDGSWQQVWIQL